MAIFPPSFWSQDQAEALQTLARQAGASIMAHRDAADAELEHKADGSPVTAADRDSQQIIIEGLGALTPDIPVISEEKDNPADLIKGGTCWLVDPLDGTIDFIAGGNEFSVNIGLLFDHQPAIGVIYAPAKDDLFYGDPYSAARQTARGETVLTASAAAKTATPPRLLTSRSEARRLPLHDWLVHGRIGAWRPCSSAYKFGLLAAGEADLYPRCGATYEWDTAAGDAILRAVGGGVVALDGQPLAYGKREYRNTDFTAFGPAFDAALLPAFLALLADGKAA